MPATPPARPAPHLDVRPLLRPIPGADPAGRPLRFDPAMQKLEDWSEERDIPAHLLRPGEQPKAADWKAIVASATDLLADASKDLEIAARLAEALARIHGLSGLRDGLRLFLGIHVLYWPTYYPRATGMNLAPRHKPFKLLEARLPPFLRNVPLAAGPDGPRFTLARLTVTAGVPDVEADPSAYREAIAGTPAEFYLSLSASLAECRRVVRHIEWSNRKTRDGAERRLSPMPCRLSVTAEVLERLQAEVGSILEGKGIRVAPPTPPTPTPPAPPAPTPADLPTGPGASSGAIGGPDDARRRIAEAAAYLREHAPRCADGLLAARALLVGRLLELDAVPHPLRLSQVAASPPLDRAAGSIERKEVEAAVPFLRDALNAATTGRDRFQIKLFLAEILLTLGRRPMAQVLADELASQVEEHRLEQWEDPRIAARVWAVLLGCLKPAADEEPSSRYQEVFARLCRLDIDTAYRLSAEKS